MGFLKRKMESKDNVGVAELNDDVLEAASGGSQGWQTSNGYLLLLGGTYYMFDNENEANTFKEEYFKEKARKAASS